MRKKTYRQNCSLAYAADLLGERWTLLIFRELLIRPCRYGELNECLQGMGSNLLAARLKELEQGGLIEKQDANNKRAPYQLTSTGYEVEPVVFALIRWGYRFAEADAEYTHHHHWDLLAMKAFYVAERCRKPMIVQFLCDELTAWVSIGSKGFIHGMGHRADVDITFAGSIQSLESSFIAGQPELPSALRAFVDCFELPRRLM
jgi:DNA-binding HxlR family transcriptional regulator